VLAPHGIFAAAGEDQWLALSVQDDAAFRALAGVLQQADWLQDPTLANAAGRRAQADRLEPVIARWVSARHPMAAAAELQAAGVAAAPLLKAQELPALEHFAQTGFYIDLEREISGPQRQLGVAILQDGQRLGARQPAPLLGEHSQTVLARHAQVDASAFAQLLAQGVVSFAPTPSRNLVSPTASASS
jgi:crotonobetainyl-CoA:carnitine CoA-transferase CaiB-like acyl-CoA transferase